MAAGLPLSVQERVMFFVGNASSEAEAPSNDATAARKLTTVPAAQASPPRPPLGDAGARRRRLSPSDVFVLSQETGPGFVVIDDFLGGEGREAALSISAAARSTCGKASPAKARPSRLRCSYRLCRPPPAASRPHPSAYYISDMGARPPVVPRETAIGTSTRRP